MSCKQIEDFVGRMLGDYDKACGVFKDNIYNGKSIYEACCMCGGSDERPVAPSSVPTTSLHPSASVTPSLSMIPTTCENEPNWKLIGSNASCSDLEVLVDKALDHGIRDLCIYFQNYQYEGKNIQEACCVCGGGDHIPVAPSAIPSITPTVSVIPSAIPSWSISPSDKPTVQPTSAPSDVPTFEPTAIPSKEPSQLPTDVPSSVPSEGPTFLPTDKPTTFPSNVPSLQPSDSPTVEPSTLPTFTPSFQPSILPSTEPSPVPSREPTTTPSVTPSGMPSIEPSFVPTNEPSMIPSNEPSTVPSYNPTGIPSQEPSYHPSRNPSKIPTVVPSSKPTEKPSGHPSEYPSWLPSDSPSVYPSTNPSTIPSSLPSDAPSNLPSATLPSTPTEFVCKNSESFEYDLRTCQKIALSDDRVAACTNPEVERNCPITCGVCCEDDETYFFRTNSNKRKSCAWIAKSSNRLKYCNTFRSGKMVRVACPNTCSYCPPYDDELPLVVSYPTSDMPTSNTPTYAPVAISTTPLIGSPSSTLLTCKNNHLFAYQVWPGGKKRSCSNIGATQARRSRLCKINEVQTNCPITCGLCCEDDETFRFTINSGKIKPCSWIGKAVNRKQKYCNLFRGQTLIKEACPVTCGACF